MKTTLVFAFALLGNMALYAQLASWSFENLTSAVPKLPIAASYIANEVASGNASLSGGNNIGSPSVCSGRTWATNFWPTANSASLKAYMSFTITAKPKQELHVSGFYFSTGISSSSGPEYYDIYVWENGVPTSIGGGINGAGGCGGAGVTYAANVPKGGSITFSIHPYGQNPAAMAATMRVDDIEIDGSAILPIELLDFSAKKMADQTIYINWQTASELNNDFVAIERSTELPYFSEIGRIVGEGNSNEVKNYSFVDQLPRPGTNYYRLRQVDVDGSEHFSSVIAVEGSTALIDYLIAYPSPTLDRLYLRRTLATKAEKSTLYIYDGQGRLVKMETLPSQQEIWEIDVASLSPGVYSVLLHDSQTNLQQRFIKH